MRIHEILVEKAPTKNEFNSILNDDSITIGFECEMLIPDRRFYDIEQEFEDQDQDMSYFRAYLDTEIGTDVRTKVRNSLIRNLGVKVMAYTSPTSTDRDFMDYSQWGVIHDGSISGEGVGCEVVSPVMELNSGLKMLEKTFVWMDHSNYSTNGTTGLHINLAIKGTKLENFDIMKMMLFYDESFTMSLFNRQNEFYAKEMKAILAKANISNPHDLLNSRAMAEVTAMLKKTGWKVYGRQFNKYFSVRVKDFGDSIVFEFRAMGNSGYESRFSEIRKQIVQMANILKIGSSDLYEQEYVRKIYTLINGMKYHKVTDDKASTSTTPTPVARIVPPELSSFVPFVVESPYWFVGAKNNPEKLIFLLLGYIVRQNFGKIDEKQARQLRQYLIAQKANRRDFRSIVEPAVYDFIAKLMNWPKSTDYREY